MKAIIYKYFIAASTRNYVGILPKMVPKYNNTGNRSISCTPMQARLSFNSISLESIGFRLASPSKVTFKTDDVVRIARKKAHLGKRF